MQAVDEDLQLPYTMDKHQLSSTSYQARVLRTDVNRSIPTYIPEILDESILAMTETFKPMASGPHYDLQFVEYYSFCSDRKHKCTRL